MKSCRQRGALVSLLLVACRVCGVTLKGVVFENLALRISETYGKGSGGKSVQAEIPTTRRRLTQPFKFWKSKLLTSFEKAGTEK